MVTFTGDRDTYDGRIQRVDLVTGPGPSVPSHRSAGLEDEEGEATRNRPPSEGQRRRYYGVDYGPYR